MAQIDAKVLPLNSGYEDRLSGPKIFLWSERKIVSKSLGAPTQSEKVKLAGIAFKTYEFRSSVEK